MEFCTRAGRILLALTMLVLGTPLLGDEKAPPRTNEEKKPESAAKDEPSQPPGADKRKEAKDDAGPEDIEQEQPSFYVRVSINKPNREYHENETIIASVEAEIDAYAYVLYKQADGKVYQIFPNSEQRDNRVKAKRATQIPAAGDLFRWQVGAPFGKEVLKVIASKEPLPELTAPELFEGRFNRVPPSSIGSVREKLAATDPRGWAEDVVELTTSKAPAPQPEKPSGRRVGVFFGISNFRFQEEVMEATENKWGPNLPCSANNAQLMARFLKEFSQLDDHHIFVNEEATKAGFEKAITGWLPSATKPGDTVYIFISTHGDQILDDNGDERDGKDEWIITHDYVDLGAMTTFLKRFKAGTLDVNLRPWVESTLKEIAARKLTNEQIQQVLASRTGITDDLFGHWLQRLSGRRVVVLMETCHSGGFATNEKSLKPSSDSIQFDFLDEELGRLKDLGQPDSVLLTACRAQEVAYAIRARDEVLERMRQTKGELDGLIPPDQQVGMLTYYLAEGLAIGPRGMTIEDLHRHVQQGFQRYFVEINEINKQNGYEPLKPHFSELFKLSSQPVIVKP